MRLFATVSAVALLLVLVQMGVAAAQSKVASEVLDELQETAVVKVIVALRPNPMVEGGGASLSNPAGYLSRSLDSGAFHISAIGRWPLATAEVTAEAVATLESDPNVSRVLLDLPVPPALFDSVPLIGADKYHAGGITGVEAAVAVLDTGIQSDHPAFANSIVAEGCFSTAESRRYQIESLCPNGLDMDITSGAAGGCPASISGCFHGTHVAGIVAGHNMVEGGHTFDGVAPSAKLVPVTVFTKFLSEEDCRPEPAPCVLSFASDQLRALDWLYKHKEEHRLAAVNMSLGSGYFDHACDADNALTEAVERLRAAGVITVIAAGNDKFYDAVSTPGCISSAFTVSALNKSGQIDLNYANISPGVDIVAPGTAIVSATLGSDMVSASGTSMAAPHVAAMIALLRQLHPSASASEIEDILRSSGGSVIDERTDTRLVKALLPAPNAPVVTPANVPFWTKDWSGDTFQYIIKSDQSEDAVRAMITECSTCGSIKQIGEGQYVVEVDPFDPSATDPTFSPKEQLLKSLQGQDVQVFSNDIARPSFDAGGIF